MDDPARTLGIVSGFLGVGSPLVRNALKRYEWNLPRWVDALLGLGGLIFILAACGLLWQTFLQMTGVTLPKNSAWPATFFYTALVIVAVLGSSIISTGGIPYYSFGDSSRSSKAGWQLRPNLRELLESVDFIKNNFPKGSIKLKIVATEQGKELADSLVDFFRCCHCDIEVNQDGGSYVFATTESFRGVRLRHRQSNMYSSSAVFNPISILAETPHTEYFPEIDAFNFVQIEVGDGSQYL